MSYRFADDGQRNCPKHVEFYSKNKFEKLVHLVGFIIRIYHDVRSPERKIQTTVNRYTNNQNTHTHTHTLQNPHIHTPTHYKPHTYTHPHITKPVKTTTVQVKTTTVQDIPK